MKKITTTLFVILALLTFEYAKAQNNLQPAINKNTNNKFQNCINSIRSAGNEQTRYDRAYQYFISEYSTTKQLQDACNYLRTDESKYNLCLYAYPRITDRENFFDIYNSFSSFSYAMKLYHNTQAKGNNGQQNVQVNTNTQGNNATFNGLIKKGDYLLKSEKFDEAISMYEQAMNLQPNNLVSYSRIEEAKKRKQSSQEVTYIEVECSTTEQEFGHIMNAIKDQTFSDRQKKMAKKYIAKKCLSMNQLKRIVSIFSMDDDKLEIIKYLYDYAPDTSEMYLFRNMLTFSSTKRKFDQFLVDKQ